ncbi:hypothetical protein [uncultured Friedmanniella sp.]|uniref:hypothetical protein n=1 Tax=uncultured Friedmanniella sp. TaxID=335381 RepID=UPI0035C95016
MTLKITATPTTGLPTRITVTSDKRVTPAVPAVTESATITVATADETQVYKASREVAPAVPRTVALVALSATLDSGRKATFTPVSDDGQTAVYDVTYA